MSMDIRCLLLCVIFVCLCLCDQSVPASARTLQRADLKSEGSSADSVGRESSYGQAAEETEIRAYSEWRSKMTQEDLIQEGHSRGSLDASQGDAASAQRRLEETKDGAATKGEEGTEQKPKEKDTKEHEKELSDSKSPEAENSPDNAPTKSETGSPIEYLRNSKQQKNSQYSSYSSFVTPMVGVYVLLFVFILVLAGALMCYKCCGRKRSGDVVKYQQLEMNASGLGTPKERAEESTDGWDENWDDDWEDTEAVKSSSRLSQNLSSRGLAARRGNKDGWDSSWDD